MNTYSLTFSQKESICQDIFDAKGPFWHLCSDGSEMQDFLLVPQDYIEATNLCAAAIYRNNKATILTYELMSNHFHFVLSGQREPCIEFAEDYFSSIRRLFKSLGKAIDWSRFKYNLYPIEDLRALRNEILYVNRNAYLVHSQYTPYSYPWGGGISFFNPVIKHLSSLDCENISLRLKRSLLHCRDTEPYKGLKFFMNIAYIPSFCNIALAESLFTDARSYHSSLNRNAEAFGIISKKLNDSLCLTDDELYSVAVHISKERFNCNKFYLLEPSNKIELAKELHYKYKASNQQLRRLLRIDSYILNELFPTRTVHPQ